jgi:hypothetical protein
MGKTAMVVGVAVVVTLVVQAALKRFVPQTAAYL